jgi:uncharacterized repeat protein (TIGR03833 family)
LYPPFEIQDRSWFLSFIFHKQVTMEGTRRADVRPGIDVMVELSEDKRTGRLTGGKVKEILTTAPVHPHGIKVRLENGQIGRIKQIIQSN